MCTEYYQIWVQGKKYRLLLAKCYKRVWWTSLLEAKLTNTKLLSLSLIWASMQKRLLEGEVCKCLVGWNIGFLATDKSKVCVNITLPIQKYV